MSEQTNMDKLTTEMAEYICDKICRFPYELTEDELEEKCAGCKMGVYVCHILNEYNEINDFDKTQSAKLLRKIGLLRAKMRSDLAKKPIVNSYNETEADWKCPVCGLNVVEEPPCCNFCERCGQRLDWNGVEE